MKSIVPTWWAPAGPPDWPRAIPTTRVAARRLSRVANRRRSSAICDRCGPDDKSLGATGTRRLAGGSYRAICRWSARKKPTRNREQTSQIRCAATIWPKNVSVAILLGQERKQTTTCDIDIIHKAAKRSLMQLVSSFKKKNPRFGWRNQKVGMSGEQRTSVHFASRLDLSDIFVGGTLVGMTCLCDCCLVFRLLMLDIK